jgi:hypothetical protein
MMALGRAMTEDDNAGINGFLKSAYAIAAELTSLRP